MAIGIKGEGYKVSESQAGQIESAARNVSEEKCSSAQEMPVNTNENEQHSKGAREIATSKKADAQLQAMSLQIQLNASSALSEPGNNNVQQLAQSSSDESPVDSKAYAQQNYSDSLTKIQNPYESLREEIADEREGSENSTKADETLAELITEGESEPFKIDMQQIYQDYQKESHTLDAILKDNDDSKRQILKNTKD
jgi:hypothetical protein